MITGLVQYKFLFMAQLLLGEGMFLLRLERRGRFGVRAVGCAAALLVIAGVFPIVQYTAWYVSFLFLSLFVCTLPAMRLCFDEPWENLLFCGIAGYTVQHLAYLLFTVIGEVTQMHLLFGGVPDPYSSAAVDLSMFSPVQIIFYVNCYFLVYACTFELFDRKLKGNHDLHLGRTNLICLSGLLIAADVIFNMITNYYTTASRASLLLERGYNVLVCVLILALLYNQLSRRELKAELDGVQHILEQGKKQYELARQNIDLINMKYHDLKHRSEALSARGAAALEEKAELDRALEGYSALVKTGSEVLDVILSEKMLLCRERGIEMTCMADGQGLGFIRTHHLYALLGNAIDNAVEAVEGLPQEKRVISLFVRSLGNLAHIHVENYYEGPLALRGGLPATTKGEKDYHGYGMPSMRAIAEQYGGTLSISAEGGIFLLDIIMAQQGDVGDS